MLSTGLPFVLFLVASGVVIYATAIAARRDMDRWPHVHRHEPTDVPHVYRCHCGDTTGGHP